MSNEKYWRDVLPGDYAVVGDPIQHSRSPEMHQAAYKALGLDLIYRAILVPLGELSSALDHLTDLGYKGVNVTVPHKEAALEWSQSADPTSMRVGAANTLDLRTKTAYNTDVKGVEATLDLLRRTPRRVLVLGAGGAAATVLEVMHRRGLSGAIWNRTPERATRLVRRLRMPSVSILDVPSLHGFDLVVNATSSSLSSMELPLNWHEANPHTVAWDLSYGVASAPFLLGAHQRGLETLDGRTMLAAQGLGSLVQWGIVENPPTPRRRDELLKIMEATIA
ncbi:MAG: hypothetical protein C4320_03945 [Armatimonadota bacterium]